MGNCTSGNSSEKIERFPFIIRPICRKPEETALLEAFDGTARCARVSGSPMKKRIDQIKNEWLVLRCQDGDPEAFEDLVRRWQEPLWRYARRLTGSEDAAWDVLQETWIAVSKGIRRLEDATAFPAWVYRITSNKSHDWIRREGRRRQVHRDYAEEHSDSAFQEPTGPKKAASLDEMLRGLPKQAQVILQLRYEQEFNTREIADILSIPEGTVKSRLYHARKRLRKYLKEESNG